MAIPHTVGAFAIISGNNLLGAVPFWEPPFSDQYRDIGQG
jgi:hypothetical protein